MTRETLVQSLQGQLFAVPEANVFAVLDGASISPLLDKLAQHQPEHYCLYSGELVPELAKAAPYIVRLEKDSTFTRWVLEGYGQHWGIFAMAKANLRSMRDHFRDLLMVEDAKGNSLYFRFYDPRIFQVFWPTCDDDQQAILFGPVRSYLVEVEGDDTGRLSYFSSPNRE